MYINYGLVTYVDRESYQANNATLQNPIIYSYLKDRRLYEDEREMRVSLSALGIGTFQAGGEEIKFPPYIHLPFDFKLGFESGAIAALEKMNCDEAEVKAVLARAEIAGKSGT